MRRVRNRNFMVCARKKTAKLIFFPTINFFTLKGCMIAWKRSCPDRQPFSDTFRDSYVVPSQYIKFIHSEKAQTYDEITKLFLSIRTLKPSSVIWSQLICD